MLDLHASAVPPSARSYPAARAADVIRIDPSPGEPIRPLRHRRSADLWPALPRQLDGLRRARPERGVDRAGWLRDVSATPGTRGQR
ncbi:MAG TPA: hypothetical protein VNI34_02425 [Candidatus Nitrosotalea sp.]|nr:hypothetical protein [Candidatus Nitrosotalea sp.]